jgi:hypothetical protein
MEVYNALGRANKINGPLLRVETLCPSEKLLMVISQNKHVRWLCSLKFEVFRYGFECVAGNVWNNLCALWMSAC